jgi:hypothetical protein
MKGVLNLVVITEILILYRFDALHDFFFVFEPFLLKITNLFTIISNSSQKSVFLGKIE